MNFSSVHETIRILRLIVFEFRYKLCLVPDDDHVEGFAHYVSTVIAEYEQQ
jgi:hypothetical protein